MSDNMLNKRQKELLIRLSADKDYSLSEMSDIFKNDVRPSSPTLRRDVAELCALGFIEKFGQRRGMSYCLKPSGMLLAPMDAKSYLATDIDKRSGNRHFVFSIFDEMPSVLFSSATTMELVHATKIFQKKSQDASEIIRQKEFERFVIELSWKSSSIEGNTYSLLDTELLIKEGVEANGHTHNEAVMILNHKKAFQYVLKHSSDYHLLSSKHITNVHRLLVDGLNVANGLRVKPVGVTGSQYVPLSIPTQIDEAMQALCAAINRGNDPYTKALLALVGLSYIQPFEDGNKRTARLVSNAILLSHGLSPLSYRSVDVAAYRESMLVFYEKNSIVPMRDIFIEQYLFSCEHYLKFS